MDEMNGKIAAPAIAQLNSLLLSLNKLKKFSFWAEKKELVDGLIKINIITVIGRYREGTF